MIESVQITRELIDQIVFGMENQDAAFYLDTAESVVVPEHDLLADAPANRYIPVPEWRSVDGYNLMEQFVATLHNPIYRERLRAILASGRGVFRQFKDTVRERREIERSWFSFKERHMRGIVTEWLNELREQAGLERLRDETLETSTEELVDIDFVFREIDPGEIPDLRQYDREVFDELYPELPEAVVGLLYREQRESLPAMDSEYSRVQVAETLGGEFAGFLWATVSEADQGRLAMIRQLSVLPDFRGLGVGRALLYDFFSAASQEKVDHVLMDLQGEALVLASHFEAYGMRSTRTTLALDVRRWYLSEHLP